MVERLHRGAALALGAAVVAGAASADQAQIDRGAYPARPMACADCHSPRDATGAPMAEAGPIGGTDGFDVPGAGIVWGPNLTPVPGGAGSWTEAEIVAALTTGTRPDGGVLIPVVPWPAYAGLTPEAALALAAFLKAQPAVENAVPALVPPGEAAPAPCFTVKMPK